jgi:TP901 family phage tail tape measure protein
MLNIQVADLWADVRIDFRGFNQDLSLIRYQLARLPSVVPIAIQPNLAAFNTATSAAMAQIRALRAAAATPINIAGRTGGFGGGGGGRGGMFGGGGFFSGLASGAGLPFTANPQMLAGEAIAGGLKAAVSTAIDLEHQFAQVRRIAGLSADEAQRLKANLLDLSTRQAGVSVADLVSMTQIGGRMGIQGVDKLEGFAQGLARVKLVIQDIDTETLANNVARVLHEFQLGTEYVEGFGSALTAMDNASTASAKDILDITQRLGGTAQAIGLTLPQVVALASVLKDVGLSNEVAGSAFSQIFRMMGSESAKLAKAAGLDAKEFADAYRRDPMEALGMLIKRLNEVKDTIGGQELIKGFGFKGVRTGGAILQLDTMFAEVAKRTKVASEETGTQKALGQAGTTVGETTASALGKLANAATGVADSLGQPLLGPIKEVTAQLTVFAQGLRANLATPGGMKTAQILMRAGLPDLDQLQGAGKSIWKNLPNLRDLMPWAGPANAPGKMFVPQVPAAGAAKPPALPAQNPNPKLPAPLDENPLNIPMPKEIFDALKRRFQVEMEIGKIFGNALAVQGKMALQDLTPEKRHPGAVISGAEYGRRLQEDVLNNIEKEILEENKQATRHLGEMVGLLRNLGKNAIAAVLPGPS